MEVAMIRKTPQRFRLIIIIIFMLSHFPRKLRFILDSFSGREGTLPMFSLLIAAGFAFFILIELYEFRRRYRLTTAKLKLLFLFRCIAALSPGYLVQSPLRTSLLIMYLTLLVFYSLPPFGIRISFFFCTAAAAVIILSQLNLLSRFAGPVDAVQVLNRSNRFVTLILFYLIAYFLKHDIEINDQNIRVIAHLSRSEAKLSDYSRQMGNIVVLEERTRIARDIHDSVGHLLTAAGLQLSKADAYFDRDSPACRSSIREAKTAVDDAMSEIRNSLGMLNERQISFDLIEELKVLTTRLEAAGVEVDYSFAGDLGGWDYAQQIIVYRFVQEGITNIIKHAAAGGAELAVVFTAERASIRLGDNGKGFDAAHSTPGTGSYGLDGLADRIELAGGHFEVKSEPGGGCVLSVELPISPVEDFNVE